MVSLSPQHSIEVTANCIISSMWAQAQVMYMVSTIAQSVSYVCQQPHNTNYGSKTKLYILIMTPQDVTPLSTTGVPPTVFLY